MASRAPANQDRRYHPDLAVGANEATDAVFCVDTSAW